MILEEKKREIEAAIERPADLEAPGRMIRMRELEFKKENLTEEERDAQVEALTGKREDPVDLKNLDAREAEAEAVTVRMTVNERDLETTIVNEMIPRETVIVTVPETEESQTPSTKKSQRPMNPKAAR